MRIVFAERDAKKAIAATADVEEFMPAGPERDVKEGPPWLGRG